MNQAGINTKVIKDTDQPKVVWGMVFTIVTSIYPNKFGIGTRRYGWGKSYYTLVRYRKLD